MRITTPLDGFFSGSSSRAQLRRGVAVLVLAGALVSSVSAQTPRPDDPNRRRGGDAQTDGGRRGGGGTPEEMQARMRERFEVTDDEEWKLISERMNKVTELRRNAPGGGFGGGFPGRGPGGNPGGDRGGDRGRGPGGGRGTGAGSTELAALSTAVRDKLPDAEIKSRLERIREIRKEHEANLSKAQEELRAVLSVRQEAMAVMFGLLP
jgi:hypothetical protein